MALLKTFYQGKEPNRPVAQLFDRMPWYFSVGFIIVALYKLNIFYNFPPFLGAYWTDLTGLTGLESGQFS